MEILIGLIVAALIAIAILKKKPAPPSPLIFPACITNADCPPGAKCINGVCMPPMCRTNEDCGPEMKCVDGRCVPIGVPPTPIPPSPYVCSVCQETFLTAGELATHIAVAHGDIFIPIPPPVPIPTPPPPAPTPTPPPAPIPQAIFVFSNLTLNPKSCMQGGTLTIKVTVANTGNGSGSASINGIIQTSVVIAANIPTKTVLLNPGQSAYFSWMATTTAFDTGVYTVTIGELSDTFTIVSPAPAAMAKISGHTHRMNALVTCSDGQSMSARGPYGDYEFTVSPGTWTITFSASGYTTVSNTLTVGAGDARTWSYPMQLAVAPPGGITGDITDEEGELHANTIHEAYSFTETLTSQTTGQKWTNERYFGFYYFDNLPPGIEYNLLVQSSVIFTDGSAPIGKQFWTYPDKLITGIVVKPGRIIEQDVVLTRKYRR